MPTDAHMHLAAIDPVMARLVETHGPCNIVPLKTRSPFEALIHAIGHQQLNGKAAEAILSRFRALFPAGQFPTPALVAETSESQLREAGLSRSKIAAIHDLAHKSIQGIVPTRRVIEKWSDQEIIEHLIQVRGVGRWTVEMLLIFTLGRPDVLPVDDFGVRHGFKVAYRKREMPKPRALATFGERWKPFRSAAAWYLWRAADAAKSPK